MVCKYILNSFILIICIQSYTMDLTGEQFATEMVDSIFENNYVEDFNFLRQNLIEEGYLNDCPKGYQDYSLAMRLNIKIFLKKITDCSMEKNAVRRKEILRTLPNPQFDFNVIVNERFGSKKLPLIDYIRDRGHPDIAEFLMKKMK